MVLPPVRQTAKGRRGRVPDHQLDRLPDRLPHILGRTPLQQQRDGPPAQPLQRHPDRGQRRVEVGADDQIVHRDHRDLRRHLHPAHPGRVQGAHRRRHVGDQDGRRPLRGLEDLGHRRRAALGRVVAGDDAGRGQSGRPDRVAVAAASTSGRVAVPRSRRCAPAGCDRARPDVVRPAGTPRSSSKITYLRRPGPIRFTHSQGRSSRFSSSSLAPGAASGGPSTRPVPNCSTYRANQRPAACRDPGHQPGPCLQGPRLGTLDDLAVGRVGVVGHEQAERPGPRSSQAAGPPHSAGSRGSRSPAAPAAGSPPECSAAGRR